MKSLLFPVVLLAAGLASIAAQPPKAPPKAPPQSPPKAAAPKGGPTVSGVIVGRSGKPVPNARLFIGSVKGDEDVMEAKIILKGLPSSQADAQGAFTLTGFEPGTKYCIVYYPAGGPTAAPPEINVKTLAATLPSTLPLMKNVEIGGGEALPERRWGPELTLLKGHRFWGYGTNMKLWKATVRRSPSGPFFEVREGRVVQFIFNDKAQIKLEAWSF